MKTAFVSLDDLMVEHIKMNGKNNMDAQHYHDSFEIYLHIDGDRYIFFDNSCHNLRPGDLVVFRPFDLHYAVSRESNSYERYVLNFRESILAQILSPEELSILTRKLTTGLVHLTESKTSEMIEYFKSLDRYSKQSGFLNDKLIASALLQLVYETSSCINDSSFSNADKNSVRPEIVSAILYINSHYTEDISLETLSSTVHMSKFHFCRVFHSATGTSPSEYLSNFRLAKVHNLLMNSAMPIAEIAYKTGFASTPQLSRAFKNTYGLSPREFRKNSEI